MEDVGIITVISVGCVVFGIVTAYLIYNFVQLEKAQYYKYKLRKEKMKQDPNNFDYVAPKEKKEKLSGPVVAATNTTKEEEVEANMTVPVPAPLLAPVHLPPVPNGSPVVPAAPTPVAPAPGPDPSLSHADAAPISATTAAAIGGVAAMATFATYEAALSNPESEPSKPQSKNKKDNKHKKQRGRVKKVEESDFDDYRNFSPTYLPPPKGAPPPQAYYNASGAGTGNAPPESDEVQSVVVETGSRGSGRRPDLPQVTFVDRNGLQF